MRFEWKGVLPALITSFLQDDRLDLDLFAINLQAQQAAGVDGVILAGSLGEASTLETKEKKTLVEFSVRTLKNKIPVILNIAEGSTKEAIHQAVAASDWGASGLMLLPPMRYKSDPRETVFFFKSVAAATDLPIMIYNNPVDYKIEVTPDMFDELRDSPNIQAVKESTRDTANVTRMVNRFGDRFKILCGVDTIALEELQMGAVGWVAGLVNAFPRETVAIYRLTKAGRLEEARSLHRWFLPLLELDIHPKLVQYIKLAASMTGLGSEYVRRPRLVLEGEERRQIKKIIDGGLSSRPKLPDYLHL
ncbi:MAG: dihydrodipicolinate synthase family protein [Chitinophagales bacterium]